VHADALASQGSEPSSSDDDGSLSDSDPDLSSDDDGYSSEAEKQRRSCKSKYPSREPVDEQRLLAYKKEGKSWSGSLASSPAGLGPQYARAGTDPAPRRIAFPPQVDSKHLVPFASRETN